MKAVTKLTLFYFMVTGSILLIFGFLYFFQVKTSIFESVNQNLSFIIENVGEAFELDNVKKPVSFLNDDDVAQNHWITILSANGSIRYQSNIARQFPLSLNSKPLESGYFNHTFRKVGKNYYYQSDINKELAFRFKIEKIYQKNSLVYYVLAGVPTESFDTALDRLIVFLFIGLAGFLAMLSMVGYIFAKYALKPVETTFKMQKQFISDVSHELKTPISILRLSLESLVDSEKMSAQGEEKIASALEVLYDMNFLIKKLLLLSKLEEDPASIVFETLVLNQVLDKCYYNLLPIAEDKVLYLKINLPSQNLLIYADAELCYIALFNIIENAIKYTETGTVGISLDLDRGHCRIIIEDSGIGIGNQDIHKIFERFYRADKSREVGNGYGIGLSIAKKIIELHKGTIKVSSEAGNGTVATVSFPCIY